jgi:hypothetical protein
MLQLRRQMWDVLAIQCSSMLQNSKLLLRSEMRGVHDLEWLGITMRVKSGIF